MAQTLNAGGLACGSVAHKQPSQLGSTHSSFAGRGLTFRAFQGEQPQSRGALQVCAGKGKGKSMMRRGKGSAMPQMQTPPTPPVDPDNAEFVIFVRSKKLPKWVPLSIVKGGTAANLLVKSLESDLGNKLYSGTLTKNIGEALYKDKAQVERGIRTQFPPLKDVRDFEYGFKIRNKEVPQDWYKSEGIRIIPPENELAEAGNVMDKAADAVKGAFDTGFKSFTKALSSGVPSQSK